MQEVKDEIRLFVDDKFPINREVRRSGNKILIESILATRQDYYDRMLGIWIENTLNDQDDEKGEDI